MSCTNEDRVIRRIAEGRQPFHSDRFEIASLIAEGLVEANPSIGALTLTDEGRACYRAQYDSAACELCGAPVALSRLDHFSLVDCNETGRGVTLHESCCDSLNALTTEQTVRVLDAVKAGRS